MRIIIVASLGLSCIAVLESWRNIALADHEITSSAVNSVNVRGLELGFPEAWYGDTYRNVSCRVSEIPDWLDGHLVALVSAAYGKRSDTAGSKLTHMLDGLAAVASIQFKNGMVRFSGKYLQTKPYKIWDFYGRDMGHSRVAWTTIRSPFVARAKERWDQIGSEYFPYNPNQDIWKIGTKIVAVTETPELGLQFDVGSLSEFGQVRLDDTNELFTSLSSIKLLTMAVHTRTEPNGDIYGTVAGTDQGTNRMYQFVFKISPDAVRTLEGAFEFGRYESSKCGSDQRYMGDKKVLAGLVRSIGTTERHIIIPITSALLNPCKYQVRNRRYHSSDHRGGLVSNGTRSKLDDLHYFENAVEFSADVPVRFLIFNKRKRQFITTRQLDSYPARFISHLLNAYEIDENRIIVDVISHDNYDQFDRSFYVDSILRESTQQLMRTRPTRFTLDIERNYVERSHLVPESVQAPMEFPSINPKYNGKRYRYAYVVQPPFTVGSQIGKINVDDHSASKNIYFSHGPTASLGQPIFVPRPNSQSEDDGVILSLGLETLSKRSVLYVIDAKTMKEMGRAEMPVVVPFGFHSRYFSRQELMDSSNWYQSTADYSTPPIETIDSIFNKIYPNLTSPSASTVTWKQEVSNDQTQSSAPIVQRSSYAGSNSNTLPDKSPSQATTISPLANLVSPVITPVDTPQARANGPTANYNGGSSRGFYLSNGTFVEVFPDGSTKSYPSISNNLTSSNQQTPPATRQPPYLSVDPSFIRFVKNQIPAPPVLTTPSDAHPIAATAATFTTFPISNNKPAPSVQIPGGNSKTSNSNLASYPRLMFPGVFPGPVTSTVTGPSTSPVLSTDIESNLNNSNYIVVDVIVDPAKRTRRPYPLHPVADDPQPATKPSTHRPHSSSITKSTDDQVDPENVSLTRLLERSRGALCRLLGKAITALGSNFCKISQAEERKNSKNRIGRTE